MWVFIRDSYLSIVQDDAESRLLQIRARIRGDIERVFPEADVAEDEAADYRFCAAVHRDRVAHAIALQIAHIDYASLVEATPDHEDDRREAYTSVWARMAEEQTRLYPVREEEPVSAFSYRIDLES